MAATVNARILITYQTPPDLWFKAIKILLDGMKTGKLQDRDIAFTDSLTLALKAGHAPSNQQIDFINLALDKLGVQSIA